MKAARLHGPKDLRIEDIAAPEAPGPGEITIRVKAVGVCGSDLHMYLDGRIGDTLFPSPLVLGHEFGGEIVSVGPDAYDGLHQPLKIGQRVAVDPQVPDDHDEMTILGHPNLAPRHQFYGVFPTNGALQEQMVVQAKNCFPIPDQLSDSACALLEPLGVAIHAMDLSHMKIASSVAIIGCGPIGLLILRLAKMAGAYPIFAFDCYPWRAEKAKAWGATHAATPDQGDPVQAVLDGTKGRGVDIAFEAAWADHSVQQCADMLRPGGRLVLVGIPGDDNLQLKHSTARRKGLTIMMARRMKHVYPRAINLATRENGVDLDDLVSHRMPLEQTEQAFKMNVDYVEGVQKIVVEV